MSWKNITSTKGFNHAMTNIDPLRFVHNEKKAWKYLRDLRWGKRNSSAICPHCGFDKPYKHSGKKGCAEKDRRYYCLSCDKTFSLLTGTVFSGTKLPLWKWMYALFEYSQKKSISAMELMKKIQVSYPSALGMLKKVRLHLLEEREILHTIFLSGETETDESWVQKNVIVHGIAERSNAAKIGRITMDVIPNRKETTLIPRIEESVRRGSDVFTDELISYAALSVRYKHHTVNHSRTFVNAETKAHTNTIEGVWSLLKKLLGGIYHGVSKQYLRAYLAEFVFRYNSRHVSNPFHYLLSTLLIPRYCLY